MPEYKAVSKEVDDLITECANKPPSFEEDGKTYATFMSTHHRPDTVLDSPNLLQQ